ncbi:MAG: hypothetical protein K5745_01615 [Saccharofermentans sp.]|nr:hypothetical protein [Saccharofermentans sp.]
MVKNKSHKLYYYLLLLVPFAVLLIMGLCTMGAEDTFYVLRWSLILALFGVAALPLGVKLFKQMPSGGFILTQVLGLLAVSLTVWTLTYMKIYRFNFPLTLLAIAALAGICYGIKPLRDGVLEKIKEPDYIIHIVIEETVFVVMLGLMCYFKGFLPNINGQEKFMDYGFVMSMLRNSKLPANDMWLSSYPINYYYFGQFVYALLIKVSCIVPDVGYNIAMCTATALPFAMSFSIGTLLIDTSEKFGLQSNKFVRFAAGILTGCAVSLWGNSHSFYYDENSIGNGLLGLFSKMGIDVGRTDSFFYPDSTRYIGWNPEVTVNGGDYTIEEFPFYSYLVGDLHAHVISMMVILLIMAIAITLISECTLPHNTERAVTRSKYNFSSPNGRIGKEYKITLTSGFVIAAVLLGTAQMTSYWDFLIYFIFLSMTVFVVNTISSKVFCDIPGGIYFAVNTAGILGLYLLLGDKPAAHIAAQAALAFFAYLISVYTPSALTRTSFQMSFMFTLAHLVSLPFNMNFEMISNSLGKCKNHSSFYQLFILWGTHVIICVTFLIVTICIKNLRRGTSREIKNKSYKPSVIGSDVPVTNPVQGFFAARNLVDVFVCGMTVVGIMLIIAPEIFYVRDIYTGGYLRSNTMFKFAFAAFIILSVAMIYSIARLIWIVNKKGIYSSVFLAVAIIFIALCFIPGHYTMAALKQRCGELTKDNYKGLDGTQYLEDYYCPTAFIADGGLKSYQDAIDWLNENVEGSPVICEAYSDSYTDGCIVSSYTGLPTVFGWQTHEWLWRYHGIVDEATDLLVSDPERDVWQLYITPRHQDIDTLYLSTNVEEVQGIIDKYGIEYIICGNLEYYKYNYDNTYTFQQLGESVFLSQNLNIFKVTPKTA